MLAVAFVTSVAYARQLQRRMDKNDDAYRRRCGKRQRPSSLLRKTTTSIVAVRRHAIVLRCRPSITIAMLAVAFVASVAVGIVDVIGDELARLGPILSTLPGAMIYSNA
jgi:hypothetical protein